MADKPFPLDHVSALVRALADAVHGPRSMLGASILAFADAMPAEAFAGLTVPDLLMAAASIGARRPALRAVLLTQAIQLAQTAELRAEVLKELPADDPRATELIDCILAEATSPARLAQLVQSARTDSLFARAALGKLIEIGGEGELLFVLRTTKDATHKLQIVERLITPILGWSEWHRNVLPHLDEGTPAFAFALGRIAAEAHTLNQRCWAYRMLEHAKGPALITGDWDCWLTLDEAGQKLLADIGEFADNWREHDSSMQNTFFQQCRKEHEAAADCPRLQETLLGVMRVVADGYFQYLTLLPLFSANDRASALEWLLTEAKEADEWAPLLAHTQPGSYEESLVLTTLRAFAVGIFEQQQGFPPSAPDEDDSYTQSDEVWPPDPSAEARVET